MKKIITLSILTLATLAVGAVDPAMAQGRGARFDFEPNKWGPQQFEKRHYQNFNPPTTSVGHGAVPKAASFLGVDPSVLKPAPKPQPVHQPMVATSVHPSMSYGQPQANIVPKPSLTATPFNPGFGAPQQNAPVVAQSLPPAAPKQMAAPSSNKSLSGRMVPKRPAQTRSAVSGRLVKPKQPSSLNAQPKVASYGNQFFSPGSTKPTSSGYSSNSDVYGQIINHHK